MQLTARCPAKVNLALRVIGLREDGYHDLETVFQAVDLWDELSGRLHADLRLRCDDPRLAPDESNLVLRAARALRRLHPDRPGADLLLRKRIPIQGGLGGGSSDAAGALRLCAGLWDLDLAEPDLHALARGLGADVPFFLHGGTAVGHGRGDRIEALPFVGPLPLLLGFPPFGISTAEVFDRYRARLTHPRNGVSLPLFSTHKWLEEKDFGQAVNDLEELVLEGWPELGRFRDSLLRVGARAALVSGSGSTVFGIFEDRGSVTRAGDELRAEFDRWRLLPTTAVPGAAEVVPPGR